MEQTAKNEFLGKIVVVGDSGVGKTSFIKRLVDDIFSPYYKETIGVDFALKVANNDDKTFRLQLWDIAGKERFGNMTRTYFKEAVAAFVVTDATRPATFDGAVKWMQKLKEEVDWTDLYPADFNPIVLVVNKTDLFHNGGDHDYDEFCKKYNFHSWVGVSSKEGVRFQKALSHMIDICKITKVLEKVPVKIDEHEPLLSISKPYTNPKKEINPIIGFMRSLVANFNDRRLTDDAKRISFIRLTLFSVYFDDEPVLAHLRETMKSDAQTKLVIEGIHKLILEKSTTDAQKLSSIMDFLLECGLKFLQEADNVNIETKKPE